jgi:tetratricopeptide (TPR) repeat protein
VARRYLRAARCTGRYGQAITWDSLGYAHHHLGHHARAIACCQRALDLHRDIGDRYFQADTLTHLGDTHHAAGHPGGRPGTWQRALAILDELNHPDAEQLRAKVHRSGCQ